MSATGWVAWHSGSGSGWLEGAQGFTLRLHPVCPLLLSFGPPAIIMVEPMPYVAVQQLLDVANPEGLRNYWSADDERNIDSTRNLAASMRPSTTGRVSLNYIGSEGLGRVKAGSGPEEVRAHARAQAEVGSGQRLPAQPEHPARVHAVGSTGALSSYRTVVQCTPEDVDQAIHKPINYFALGT